MTTLHITIGDRDGVRSEALQFVRDAEAGELDHDDHEDRMVLQFGSYGDLVDSLTPRRLELLRTIATEHPASIRETARLVDRDVSDVHADLERLDALDLVEYEEGGPGGAKRPTVRFDRIEVDVDISLVDDASLDHVEA